MAFCRSGREVANNTLGEQNCPPCTAKEELMSLSSMSCHSMSLAKPLSSSQRLLVEEATAPGPSHSLHRDMMFSPKSALEVFLM